MLDPWFNKALLLLIATKQLLEKRSLYDGCSSSETALLSRCKQFLNDGDIREDVDDAYATIKAYNEGTLTLLQE